MRIEDLVPNVNLEDEATEFKGIIKEGESEKKNGDRLEVSWLKEINAFANTEGGTLYIGVDNKTHEILALDHQTADQIALMIQRLVQEHLESPVKYQIRAIAVPQTTPIRYVLAVKVEKSKFLPITLKINGVGRIYLRHFGKTSIATGEDIRSMVLNSESVSFDSLPTEEQFQKENFSKLFDTYRKNNDGKELTEKELISVGFMDRTKHLARGALLFRDDCAEPRTRVDCSQFMGETKGADVFYHTKTIYGNLLKELEEMEAFVLDRSANGFVKKDFRSQTLLSYPNRALLEGLVNALGHRNYFMQGSQIEVNLYTDRLEIVSPGSLLGSKGLKNEKNLSSLPPLRRNEVICGVFELCKLMEEKGSGFDKIEHDYSSYAEEYAPFANSNESFFALTLPNLAHPGGVISAIENPKVHTLEELSSSDLKILSYCYHHSRSAKEIATYLKVTPSSYFRKNTLERLVESGYLVPSEGKPVTYKSNSNNVFPD